VIETRKGFTGKSYHYQGDVRRATHLVSVWYLARAQHSHCDWLGFERAHVQILQASFGAHKRATSAPTAATFGAAFCCRWRSEVAHADASSGQSRQFAAAAAARLKAPPDHLPRQTVSQQVCDQLGQCFSRWRRRASLVPRSKFAVCASARSASAVSVRCTHGPTCKWTRLFSFKSTVVCTVHTGALFLRRISKMASGNRGHLFAMREFSTAARHTAHATSCVRSVPVQQPLSFLLLVQR